MVKDIESGRRGVQISFSCTPAMHEELRVWAEIAGWSVSKTVFVLVAEGMKAYDKPRFPLERGGHGGE
jgi:hypothetical protein